jgi:hypothetical protein
VLTENLCNVASQIATKLEKEGFDSQAAIHSDPRAKKVLETSEVQKTKALHHAKAIKSLLASLIHSQDIPEIPL